MPHDEQGTGGRGDLPVTADLPGDPTQDRHPTTDRVVFGVTAVLTLAFVVWGATATDSLEAVSSSMLNGLIHNGGWAFMLAASGFVVFALWLAVSRYGRITLGQEGEEPEFHTVSWVAMMFSAGMGIGLMFYGVGEPLAHFTNPPPGTHPADAADAMQTAVATTLFHWTLHPWAIYAVVGLAIAYSTFRRRRRQTISAVFEPLIGSRRAHGGLGRLIDILAIFATLFGSAASLGLGALQIGSGFHELHWKEETGTGLLVLIIEALTVAFVASAVSGVEKGIQWLSNTNMVLALILAVFVSGADAASIVMGTLSQKGILEPARWVVVFWGVVTGAVTAIMLLIGNGEGDALAGLQNLTILVAAPFTLVMIGMCVALIRDLRQDPLIVRRESGVEAVESAVVAGHAKYAGDFEIRIGPGGGRITTGLPEGPGPSGPPSPSGPPDH
ncbi:BCCT family transporter [Streptomyces sp. NPDC057963]|uniref:BCCT family transporter n=1 Tax=Streptomyces sp. NPDC057963 TaxID=3346290 RepID=UPI0036F0BB96